MNNRFKPPQLSQRRARSGSSSQRVIRLVTFAVLIFTLAIALPFLAPVAIFPDSLFSSEDSAPVVVDGRSIFRVTDTATTASAAARAAIISRSLQPFARQQRLPEIQVDACPSILEETEASACPGERQAIVRLGFPSLEDPQMASEFTVNPGDTNETLTPANQAKIWAAELREVFTQAKVQRQEAYIRRHLLQVPVVAVIAALAYWLSGILWRGYLVHWLLAAAMEEESADQTGRPQHQFTTINLFLNATLLLLRAGIWIVALLYATNLFPNTRQVSHRISSQMIDSFTAESIPLGSSSISILDIFRVLILVLLVTVFARIVSNILKRRVLQETGINRGVQEAIAIILRYSLIFIGSIIVLQASGINLSSLTLLASALGVGAGLGLQNIVKDIGSGLVLVFERPVQVGEFVQIGEQTGTVERIGARSSEIRTLDQVSIIVPNSQFLENEVVNWSHRNPISRIRIPVGVAYKSDPEQVRKLLLRTGARHPDVLATPPALVLFREFGDSALQFDLLVWVSQPSRQYIIKSDLLFMLAEAFRKEGIEIPFPQRDVHMIWPEQPAQRDLPTDVNQ